MVTDRLHKTETGVEIPTEGAFIQIVIEQTTDTAGFVTVLQEEVLVAPILILAINVVTERVTRRFGL